MIREKKNQTRVYGSIEPTTRSRKIDIFDCGELGAVEKDDTRYKVGFDTIENIKTKPKTG